MSNSSHIKNSEFISSREAARFFGYTPDYVSRLARQGKINAERLGHQWFIDLGSLKKFVDYADVSHKERMRDLSVVRKIERKSPFAKALPGAGFIGTGNKYREEIVAVAQAGTVVFSGFLLALIFSLPSETLFGKTAEVAQVVVRDLKFTAYGIYHGLQIQTEIESSSASVIEAQTGNESPENSKNAPTEGVVLYANTGTDLETIDTIRDSFSDPVDISRDPLNQNVGIITPRFESGGSDRYRFLIVPVESP